MQLCSKRRTDIHLLIAIGSPSGGRSRHSLAYHTPPQGCGLAPSARGDGASPPAPASARHSASPPGCA